MIKKKISNTGVRDARSNIYLTNISILFGQRTTANYQWIIQDEHKSGFSTFLYQWLYSQFSYSIIVPELRNTNCDTE